MDVFELLAQEHREVAKTLDQLIYTNDPDQGEIEAVCKKLLLHMDMEEIYLYPFVLNTRRSEVLAKEAEEEHQETRRYIDEILQKCLEGLECKVKLEMLQLVLQHHVEEEEKNFFPRVEMELNKKQIQEITERMLHYRERKQPLLAS